MNEYHCPFCENWVKFEDFETHQNSHVQNGSLHIKGSFGLITPPTTLEEMKRRFYPLGLYTERQVQKPEGWTPPDIAKVLDRGW